jgi:hypothetical protein
MNVAATKKASLIELLFQKQVSETISVMLAWEAECTDCLTTLNKPSTAPQH